LNSQNFTLNRLNMDLEGDSYTGIINYDLILLDIQIMASVMNYTLLGLELPTDSSTISITKLNNIAVNYPLLQDIWSFQMVCSSSSISNPCTGENVAVLQ